MITCSFCNYTSLTWFCNFIGILAIIIRQLLDWLTDWLIYLIDKSKINLVNFQDVKQNSFKWIHRIQHYSACVCGSGYAPVSFKELYSPLCMLSEVSALIQHRSAAVLMARQWPTTAGSVPIIQCCTVGQSEYFQLDDVAERTNNQTTTSRWPAAVLTKSSRFLRWRHGAFLSRINLTHQILIADLQESIRFVRKHPDIALTTTLCHHSRPSLAMPCYGMFRPYLWRKTYKLIQVHSDESWMDIFIRACHYYRLSFPNWRVSHILRLQMPTNNTIIKLF